MVLYFEKKNEERGWENFDPLSNVVSIEKIKIGHSYYWFIVYEDGTFGKLSEKEYRLNKVSAYEQTMFFFE